MSPLALVAVEALMMLLYNRSPLQICEALWPLADERYHLEKATSLSKSVLGFWGSLDAGNKRRLVSLAMRHYSSEAPSRILETLA